MAISTTPVHPAKVHQDCLLVLDSRTARSYQIPIENNAISGVDIGSIIGPVTAADTVEETTGSKEVAANFAKKNSNGATSMDKLRGLRVLDPGLENIAIMKSSITFM